MAAVSSEPEARRAGHSETHFAIMVRMDLNSEMKVLTSAARISASLAMRRILSFALGELSSSSGSLLSCRVNAATVQAKR